MSVALCVGVGVGAAATATAVHLAGRTVKGHEVASVDRDRSVAALLVGADHDSRVERLVDTRTGGLGFSHVVLDAGERDDTGARLVYDCFPREGVRRVRFSQRYGSNRDGTPRPVVRAVIPHRYADDVRAAARALVGQGYDLLTTIAPSRDRLVCSLMIVRLLPRELAACVQAKHRHAVSPNDIARAFGVSGPRSHDVMVTA